jgi:osmotically-inducible protein OsmY
MAAISNNDRREEEQRRFRIEEENRYWQGSPVPRSQEQRRDQDSNKTPNDRRWWDRAGDEVLSWLGDDYAERRRRHDGGHRGKGPKNYRRSDERIREDINDKLTDEWNIDASDIEVTVSDGEVILNGYVSDLFQKRRAADLAENISGVTHVENRIRVNEYTPKDNVNLIP